MNKPTLLMAQRLAQAARDFQQQQAGAVAKAVTVVVSGDTLVITLHEALSPAERELAQSGAGASRVRESHQQWFNTASNELRQQVKRITGVDVCEATVDVETLTGAIVQ